MKLELNKEYRTEDGRKVVMDCDQGSIMRGAIDGESSCGWWFLNGYNVTVKTPRIVALWNETPRVDRYDLEGIGFERGAMSVMGSFVWARTPEGHEWWSDNQHTPEGQARLEQMRRQWDEEHGQADAKEIIKDCLTNKEWGAGIDPERFTGWLATETTITTRIALDDQTINGVTVEDGAVYINGLRTSTEIRQAAAVLVQMADKLEGK